MLKKGDTVVMHTCIEAEEHNGTIWACKTDEFTRNDTQYVFLEGFSGCFLVEYLQLVNEKKTKYQGTITGRVLEEINKVWDEQSKDGDAFVSEVELCGFLYDSIKVEGILKEMIFNPNDFNELEDGNYFEIPINRNDNQDGMISFLYE